MARVDAWRPGLRWEEVGVILVDDAGILPFQRACFGLEEPTDVISQVYGPIPPETDARAGEVIVNVQRAREVGGADGCARELARYVAHGCLHLGGATDDTPGQRAAMRRRETAWLRTADAEGRLDGLVGRRGTGAADP